MNLFPVVLFLSCALCGMAAALGMAVCRLRHQEQSMENAAHQIAEYILDRRKGGIECSEEGAMYRLFHEVNSLVTMADAHADSERRAKEFLRRTISDISHQLKTPIAALNIYNGILQQETADAATVREFTSLSEQELDRIESLVQSLLKMARLDAGAITLERAPENVFDLLEHIKRQYSFRAEQEGKEIALEGDEQKRICFFQVSPVHPPPLPNGTVFVPWQFDNRDVVIPSKDIIKAIYLVRSEERRVGKEC